jgi:dUTP pyrophosphatase
MKLRIVNKSTNELPKYESKGSAGFDLSSNVDDVIKVGDWRLIKTGLFMEIPKGFVGDVRPRSGLAYKKGITVLNTPGTVDSDYRGEIGVILINKGSEDFFIHKGDRIAQMVIVPVTQVTFEQVEKLEETARGAGGFGSTGVSEQQSVRIDEDLIAFDITVEQLNNSGAKSTVGWNEGNGDFVLHAFTYMKLQQIMDKQKRRFVEVEEVHYNVVNVRPPEYSGPQVIPVTTSPVAYRIYVRLKPRR